MSHEKRPWRVIVTNRIPDKVMELLRSATPPLQLDYWDRPEQLPQSELKRMVSAGADAIFCDRRNQITAELIQLASPRLRVISTRSAGYNHIDVREAQRHGIPVGYAPEAVTESTADGVVGLTLAASRRFKEATASVTDGSWGAWKLLNMCGHDVHSSVVGIVGLGRIGAAVAKRLRGFNCTIVYCGRAPKPDVAEPLEARFVSLDELLRVADFVIPLCPLNDETKGMFDREAFRKMKRSAVFVNAGRGGLVVQDDLVEALRSGEIYAAGLDVTTPEPLDPDHPLTKLPNCFILPHITAASYTAISGIAELGARNILAVYNGVAMPSQLKI